jgi:predicted CXXCH cytochrome family protein
MTKPKALLALLVPVVGLAIVLAGAAINGECAAQDEIGVQKLNINPHDFANAKLCSVCHTAEPPALLLDPVSICVKCHPGNIGNHPVTKHPMGLMTRIKIPSYLPLTEDGEMVCYTCHDPHRKTRNPKMLRVDYFKLCLACHVGY